MLHIQSVTKRFDGLTAVDSLDFEVHEGDIYGFLGPNGAGKTTTLRMIMGILEPDDGEITFSGNPIRNLPVNIFGYLPEERGLYQKQKLLETIVYFGVLKGLNEPEAKSRAIKWIERFDLSDYSYKKMQELSKGNQQKVQLILTLLHEPKLVVLDEPFTGLDPVNQLLLKNIIKEKQAEGVTFLFSTHQMEQVERLCTNICLINKGRIVLEGELTKIRREFQNEVVTVQFDGVLPKIGIEDFLENPSVGESTVEGVLRNGTREFIKWLNQSVEIHNFSMRPPTLEEIFIETVGEKS